ncbi:MAG: anaerobic carbon-monoxide dehydrogenase catalytic subunit [Aquificae bacterium]|nr:anaerobic carbon-monoxide dehydrogenase catalytic subunit [Aquificota bacterium]
MVFGLFKKEDLVKPISVHESVNYMYKKVHEEGLSNVADRFAEMEKIRCKFCKDGISCQLCSMGPCRITPKTPRGVCGIDAHGIVMRNLLIKANMGLAAYTYHAREAALTLIKTGKGETPFTIKDESKLKLLAEIMDVDTSLPIDKMAVEVGEKYLHYLAEPTESTLVEKLAPEKRKEIFRQLGIFPKGALMELVDNVARSMTNIDGDYISLALAALRNGVASAFESTAILEYIQDALYGTPTPHEGYVDFGVLDPDYVNILPNGHEPFVGFALLEAIRDPKIQEKAKAAGAKGIKIVGSIETGQEMLQRVNPDGFAGLTHNWIALEYFLSTGAVDAFVMDMNCSLANLKEYADKYQFKLIAVTDIIGVPGSEKIIWKPGKEREVVEKIIDRAIENFKIRKEKIKKGEIKPADVSKFKRKVMAGFSTEALIKAVGGSLEPIIEAIKEGYIKGIVALINCTSLANGPHDGLTVALAEELIKRDILVIGGGCGNAGMQVAGLESPEAAQKAGKRLRELCHQLGIPPVLSFGTCTDTGRVIMTTVALANYIGVDTADLPAAVTAPEYMEQKAVVDGFSAVAMGFYTHISPTPPVGGSDKVVKLLTEEVEKLTGGKVALGDDPVSVADGIEKHILSKREKLGLPVN